MSQAVSSNCLLSGRINPKYLSHLEKENAKQLNDFYSNPEYRMKVYTLNSNLCHSWGDG